MNYKFIIMPLRDLLVFVGLVLPLAEIRLDGHKRRPCPEGVVPCL